jgi:hypothetical protein
MLTMNTRDIKKIKSRTKKLFMFGMEKISKKKLKRIYKLEILFLYSPMRMSQQMLLY